MDVSTVLRDSIHAENRPLMQEILEKLDECQGRIVELLIDSANDESETIFPVKMTRTSRKQQRNSVLVQDAEKENAPEVND